MKNEEIKEIKKEVEKEGIDFGRKSHNTVSESDNILSTPDFFGFEVDEDDNKNDAKNDNFIFDETEKNKKVVKTKKSLNKKTKTKKKNQ